MRKKLPTDMHEALTPDMREYLNAYGWHFSKKALKLAVELMRKKDPATGSEKNVELMGKDEVDAILERSGVKLENKVLYDYVYVAHMGKADYLGSSVPDDEVHLAKYIKDTVDDVDGSDELPFRFWCQKMVAIGEYIPWDEML